jgi:hypothetical protein
MALANPSKEGYGLKRVESKNARNAIVQRLTADFNLTPIIAEAFYEQFSRYYEEHTNISLSSGEIAYEAIAGDEPPGKHIRLARKITVRLRLIDFNADLEVLANFGLAGLRRHRLARVTKQAYDQGALLSYEDLAMILSTSPSTVKRDARALRQQGKFIMTRGLKQDMGPGLSHKTIICDLYFKGYTFSEIEFQTNHSESSVKRYLADFIQIASLHQQHFSVQQTRLIAQKSERLIREYLQLYETYHQQNNQRLHDLLTPTQPAQEAKKKIRCSCARRR